MRIINQNIALILMLCGIIVSPNGKAEASAAYPKTILISLDGATPRIVEQYLTSGILSTNGIGLLKRNGLHAKQVIPVTPSLTAPNHIAITTGSSAANNNVIANKFHTVASYFAGRDTSGFKAAIGGYDYNGEPKTAQKTETPKAEPLWISLRKQHKKVVAASFPGADGMSVNGPGLPNMPIIQDNEDRSVDYTIPYKDECAELKGFAITGQDNWQQQAVSEETKNQLIAAGKHFYHIRQKSLPLDIFTFSDSIYEIQVLALDSTDDQLENYDTLVFFNAADGIQPGPFSLPATGPAYVKYADKKSVPFFLETSTPKAGIAFYVSQLQPDLSSVHIARYSATFTPSDIDNQDQASQRTQNNITDVNQTLGSFFPEPKWPVNGFAGFDELELETIYAAQLDSFVDYQIRLALHAIKQNADADLVMTYIKEPDSSEHQFLLIDPRQPSNPRDADSIGVNQDSAKIARYAQHIQRAYQRADNAVQRIIAAVGTDKQGRPNSNILVVSDHGMSPYHTAVNAKNFLKQNGLEDATKLKAVTVGPVANFYINLKGREPDGVVSAGEYLAMQQKLKQALEKFTDNNPIYTQGKETKVFDKIYLRPVNTENTNDPGFGLETNEYIGQDTGDILALLNVGYNFDGSTANPRKGDATQLPILSLPKDYGAHGYDSENPDMSAIFYAAGPDIPQGTLDKIRIIDIAPYLLKLLHVKPAATVQGDAQAFNVPRRLSKKINHSSLGN